MCGVQWSAWLWPIVVRPATPGTSIFAPPPNPAITCGSIQPTQTTRSDSATVRLISTGVPREVPPQLDESRRVVAVVVLPAEAVQELRADPVRNFGRGHRTVQPERRDEGHVLTTKAVALELLEDRREHARQRRGSAPVVDHDGDARVGAHELREGRRRDRAAQTLTNRRGHVADGLNRRGQEHTVELPRRGECKAEALVAPGQIQDPCLGG